MNNFFYGNNPFFYLVCSAFPYLFQTSHGVFRDFALLLFVKKHDTLPSNRAFFAAVSGFSPNNKEEAKT